MAGRLRPPSVASAAPRNGGACQLAIVGAELLSSVMASITRCPNVIRDTTVSSLRLCHCMLFPVAVHQFHAPCCSVQFPCFSNFSPLNHVLLSPPLIIKVVFLTVDHFACADCFPLPLCLFSSSSDRVAAAGRRCFCSYNWIWAPCWTPLASMNYSKISNGPFEPANNDCRPVEHCRDTEHERALHQWPTLCILHNNACSVSLALHPDMDAERHDYGRRVNKWLTSLL